jgi:hypothetical protein
VEGLYTGVVELCPLDVNEMEWGVGRENSLALDMGCRITVMFPFHESITSLFSLNLGLYGPDHVQRQPALAILYIKRASPFNCFIK